MPAAECRRHRRAVAPLAAAWFGSLARALPLAAALCACSASGTSAVAAAGESQRGGFIVSQPAPGIFVHLGRQLALDAPGHDDIANIGFVVGRKCVAVIDSGGSVSIGRALRAAVVEHTLLPICYVINTHVHVDHILGNSAFKADGTSFVGSAALPEAMARSRDFFLKVYGGDLDSPPGPAQLIGPDRLVEQDLSLDLGGRTLVLHAWPTAHTDCDLTVYDPTTGTLWAGDLLFRERLPALDGSIRGWLAALDVLAVMPARLTVPGHGPVTRDLRSAVIADRRYLQLLADGVRGELVQGKPVEDAMEHVGLAEESHWLLWESTHPHNVLRAYEELEWE
jgi:quinoprotein relay system zinc metallohydrolase 2